MFLVFHLQIGPGFKGDIEDDPITEVNKATLEGELDRLIKESCAEDTKVMFFC